VRVWQEQTVVRLIFLRNEMELFSASVPQRPPSHVVLYFNPGLFYLIASLHAYIDFFDAILKDDTEQVLMIIEQHSNYYSMTFTSRLCRNLLTIVAPDTLFPFCFGVELELSLVAKTHDKLESALSCKS
jgi:hypothetical protein